MTKDHWHHQDVLLEGRRLLATGRITNAYAPVLSEALKDLEKHRACLAYLWDTLRLSEKLALGSEMGETIEELLEKVG